MRASELRRDVVRVVKACFRATQFGDRVRFFVGTGNSFEGWVNWELAYAFARRHPERKAYREVRYAKGGHADIKFCDGFENPRGVCHLESKLVWSNNNRGKMLGYARSDAQRLLDAQGCNLLLIMTISAARAERSWLVLEDAPDAILDEVSGLRLRRGRIGKRIDLPHLDVPGSRNAVGAFVRSALFRVR